MQNYAVSYWCGSLSVVLWEIWEGLAMQVYSLKHAKLRGILLVRVSFDSALEDLGGSCYAGLVAKACKITRHPIGVGLFRALAPEVDKMRYDLSIFWFWLQRSTK